MGRDATTGRLSLKAFSFPVAALHAIAGATTGAAWNETGNQTRRKAPGNYPHAS